MTTIWNLPRVEIREIPTIKETRPVALLTGKRAWQTVSTLFNDLPLVVQAEPESVERAYIEDLASNLPEHVRVIYGVGGGMVADVAKYIGWKHNLPVVLVPTVLSVDGFFTPIVAVREDGTVGYEETGSPESVILDLDVIREAPAHLRGTGIVEILSIVTGLLDWRLAADRSKNPFAERFQPWAASLAAGIAQQAFKIAQGIGEGKRESLRELLGLICMEVQLTNQLGHTRPQEGSEQYFAYAIESKIRREGRGLPYADLVGPGILIASALHKQDVSNIRNAILSAGVRIDQLSPEKIVETLEQMPEYVAQHHLPYSVFNEFSPTPENINQLLSVTGLG